MKEAGTYLYSHIWKSFIRNERWRRNLITRLLYALVGLNFIFIFLTLGLDVSSTIAGEGREASGKFHEWIVWYLLADYLVRCIIQPVPSLDVVPYLRFRIRRSKLAGNIIIRSLFSLFNFLPLFLILPFVIKVTAPFEGIQAALLFLGGSFLLVIMNNILALMTGMLTRINPLNWLIPIGIATAFFIFDRMGGSVGDISRSLGMALTEGRPLAYFIPAVLITAAVILINRLLHQYLRVDRGSSVSSYRTHRNAFTGRLARFGDTGRYMSLEMAMILRNKRPRNAMFFVLFFIVYAFIFFLAYDEQERYINMLFTTMFLGLGAMSYGQLLFSWESTYFDGVMAGKNDFLNYVRAKYYLQAILTLITFIPIAVLSYISGRISVLLTTALMIYLLGPNSCLTMLLATLNDGKVDLEASTFMNYQGVKGSQFIMTFFFVIIPIAICELTSLVAGETGGIIVLATLGILFVIFHKWWLKNIIVATFMKRKYKLLEGYRKLSA